MLVHFQSRYCNTEINIPGLPEKVAFIGLGVQTPHRSLHYTVQYDQNPLGIPLFFTLSTWMCSMEVAKWPSCSVDEEDQPLSQALYPCYGRAPETTIDVVIQILPPGAKTSIHFHRHTLETFWALDGEVHIACEGTPRGFLTREPTRVEPGTPHALHNSSGTPAFVLLTMNGGPPYPDRSDHYRFP